MISFSYLNLSDFLVIFIIKCIAYVNSIRKNYRREVLYSFAEPYSRPTWRAFTKFPKRLVHR